MEIIDAEFRHRSPEDESAIRLLQFDADMLRKDIRNARIGLYVLIIVTLGGMVVGYFKHPLEDVLLEGIFLLILFAGGAWYVQRNAKIALIVGLSGYLLQTVVYAFLSPETLARGIFFKAALIYYLVKGVIAAVKFEKIRAQLQEYGEEVAPAG